MNNTKDDLSKKLKREKDLELLKVEGKQLLNKLEFDTQQEEINKNKKIFQVFLEESRDVFEIIDMYGNIKYVSGLSEEILGYKQNELLGKNIYDFCKDHKLDILKKMIEDSIRFSQKTIQQIITFTNNFQRSIYLNVQIKNLIHEPYIEGIVINFRDITNIIGAEDKINNMSGYNRITELPNYNYLSKQLEMEYKSSKGKNSKFALMMLDIESIKNITYSLGDNIANQLILVISNKLIDFSNSYEGVLVSRYSYDQFAIIIKGFEKLEDYRKLAEELIGIFSEPYNIGNYELDVSANIGVGIYPDYIKDLNSISKKVNATLMKSKKEGENIIKFYSPDLDIENYKEYLIRTHLRHAVERRELKVYYQPMVNLKNHQVVGAEALIRWEHPKWGIVSPNDFIPLAEETGVIIDIGKWILREVCYNYKQWMEKDFPDIKISINLSSIQFFESNFVNHVKEIIDEFGLDPSFLIMEISESTIIRQTDKVTKDIKKLQSLGIQIAIDNFGKGFSSLIYLNSFNIDIVKIDRSFTKNSVLDKTTNIIISTLIDMAKKLKIKLVAEGIETWEQLNYLRELNCNVGQGFLYSKPVDLGNFEKILYTGRCKPVIVNNFTLSPRKERRRFFRINFSNLLEANLTIKEIKGKKVNVGNTKILVKNMGPGGLCFISNIKLPVEKYFMVQFVTELIEEEIKVNGHIVWSEEVDDNLYEYGVEFIVDENERDNLIKVLNKVQIKIKKDILFCDGSFINDSPKKYFNVIIK